MAEKETSMEKLDQNDLENVSGGFAFPRPDPSNPPHWGPYNKVSFKCNGCGKTISFNKPQGDDTLFGATHCNRVYSIGFRSGRIVDQDGNGVGGVSWSD